jgi:hypothetical protein
MIKFSPASVRPKVIRLVLCGVVFGLTLLIPGCMSQGKTVDLAALHTLSEQHPTCASVRSELGAPTQITLKSDGTSTMTYNHSAMQLDPTGLKSQSTQVVIDCDAAGHMATYSVTQAQTGR